MQKKYSHVLASPPYNEKKYIFVKILYKYYFLFIAWGDRRAPRTEREKTRACGAPSTRARKSYSVEFDLPQKKIAWTMV